MSAHEGSCEVFQVLGEALRYLVVSQVDKNHFAEYDMNAKLKAVTAIAMLLPVFSYAAEKASEASEAPEGSVWVMSPQQQYFAVDGKVTVQQFVSHGSTCRYCYTLGPRVEQWEKSKEDYISFERVTVSWGSVVGLADTLYNYANVMAADGKIGQGELTLLSNNLLKLRFEDNKDVRFSDALSMFQRYGVDSQAALEGGVRSLRVVAENKRSRALVSDYRIEGIPVFVISGKYMVSFETLKSGSPEVLFSAINRIAASEHERSMQSAAMQ